MLKRIFSKFTKHVDPYENEFIKACLSNQTEQVKDILNSNDQIDIDDFDYLALKTSIRNKNIPLTELLLERGADINLGGSNSLFLQTSDRKIIRYLLRKGADPEGMIYHSIAKGSVECTKEFLDNGIKLKKLPFVFLKAIKAMGNPEMIKLISDHMDEDKPLTEKERVRFILAYS